MLLPRILVPGGDGSLQIEWHEKDGELEYDLSVEGSRSIWIRDHRTGEQIEGDDDRADALFSRWNGSVSVWPVDDDWLCVPSGEHVLPLGTLGGSSFYSYNSIT